MKFKVIVINGAAESGKDKCIDYIKNNFDQLKICNLSTIDPSKDALLELGWDGKTKNEETRQAMVDLKQISIKLFNGPFNHIVREVSGRLAHDVKANWIFFVHCREPEEIQKLANHFEELCLTLLVRNPRGKALENGADNVVENYDYDYIIENNGSLQNLRSEAIKFARKHLI